MRQLFLTGAGILVLASAACTTTSHEGRGAGPTVPATPPSPAMSPSPETTSSKTNPLLDHWSGPYGGVPAFDQIRIEHFRPALETSMDEYRREIAGLANEPAAPTFENTIAAFEKLGQRFEEVSTLYGIWSSSLNGPEFQALEREMAPRLAALSDEIIQNERLFQRIAAVYESPEKAKLTPEQQRLVWHHYTRFVRSGAKLDAEKKKQLSALNQRLASLYTNFGQNVLADEEGYALVLESEAELDGLPESVRAGAAAAAASRGLAGKWAITNTRSSMEPFLTYSARRDLREKVWRNYVNRGDNGDARDNNKHISEILQLRAERAKLLGYQTHAHWRLENTMAKTPERAMQLMEAVWTPAVARARRNNGLPGRDPIVILRYSEGSLAPPAGT